MNKFAKGQKAIIFRTTTISCIDDDENYPVEVKSDGFIDVGVLNAFTSDGKLFEEDIRPSLFTEDEIKMVIIAKLALDIMPEGEYIAQNSDGWWAVHGSEPTADEGEWWSNNTEYFCKGPYPAEYKEKVFQISELLNTIEDGND